ncbi:MAG: MarR family winged helix-turn-helix transcriptional regulator [Gemmataceae bacterium]
MSGLTLQTELRKKKPFDSLEQEVGLNLARTEDELMQEFARLFGEYDLSPSQYNVLRILRGRGGEGTPCQEIAGQMINHMPDITRLVDRLEEAKLVERQRTRADRRVVLVKITRKGTDLLTKLDRPVLDLHKKLLGHLSDTELTELNRLLTKVRQKT